MLTNYSAELTEGVLWPEGVGGGHRNQKETSAKGTGDGFLSQSLADKFFRESQRPAVRALDRIVVEIAPTEIPVLIVGESGTGKEVLALHIHRLSGHQNGPFQKLVCATLRPEPFGEFFQNQTRADGPTQLQSSSGTIFLDEISELTPPCQPMLLHALPDGELQSHEPSLRARLISSTRRNLEGEIQAGRFREDLYYRLNDVSLRLPPLRHRKEDIPGLVDFFLMKYALQFGRPKVSVGAPAMAKLLDYSWPGNIRQLENAVKRIVALGDERLALADLGSLRSGPTQHNGGSEKLSLKQASRAASQQAERKLILTTLGRTYWNRKRAARELQISYKALLYKLKQIGLDDSAGSTNPAGEYE